AVCVLLFRWLRAAGGRRRAIGLPVWLCWLRDIGLLREQSPADLAGAKDQQLLRSMLRSRIWNRNCLGRRLVVDDSFDRVVQHFVLPDNRIGLPDAGVGLGK